MKFVKFLCFAALPILALAACKKDPVTPQVQYTLSGDNAFVDNKATVKVTADAAVPSDVTVTLALGEGSTVQAANITFPSLVIPQGETEASGQLELDPSGLEAEKTFDVVVKASVNGKDLPQTVKLSFTTEPEAPITIDGKMSDWDAIGGLAGEDGKAYVALKATYDKKYLYLYSLRTWHDGLWTEDGYGYYYYCLEVDGDPETGQKNPNGQHEFPYGIDAWFFARPFLGSPTAPVFATSPKGGSYPTDFMAHITCNGSVDVLTKNIATEMRIPREDLLIEKGQTIKIHSRGNKSADNLVDTPLSLKIEN